MQVGQEKYYLLGVALVVGFWSSLGHVVALSCGFARVVGVVDAVVVDGGGDVIVVGGDGGRSDGGDGGGCCAGWGELAVQEGSPGQELGRGEIYELLSVPVAEFPKMD